MASLLIKTTPHQVLPELAAKIGINEALFLQQLHFLLTNNDCYEYESNFWYRNTVSEWLDKFPYFSKNTFRRTVDSLHKQKLICREKLHYKLLKISSNNTVWYSINYDQVDVLCRPINDKIIDKKREKARQKQAEISSKPLAHMESPKMGLSEVPKWDYRQSQNGQSLYKIKDIKDLCSSSNNTPNVVADSFDKEALFDKFLNDNDLSPELTKRIKAKSDIYNPTYPSEKFYIEWLNRALSMALEDNKNKTQPRAKETEPRQTLNNIIDFAPRGSMATTSKKKQKPVDQQAKNKKEPDPQVKSVFEYWQQLMKSPRSRLDAKRQKLISKAIDDYSLAEAKLAILGCSKSGFHMGENENNKKFNSINLIFRDADKIEGFIDNATNQPKADNDHARPNNNTPSYNQYTQKQQAIVNRHKQSSLVRSYNPDEEIGDDIPLM